MGALTTFNQLAHIQGEMVGPLVVAEEVVEVEVEVIHLDNKITVVGHTRLLMHIPRQHLLVHHHHHHLVPPKT